MSGKDKTAVEKAKVTALLQRAPFGMEKPGSWECAKSSVGCFIRPLGSPLSSTGPV